MKAFSVPQNSRFLWMALLACIMAVTAVSAVAESKLVVSRTPYPGETHTGMCCSTWDNSITINEPDKLVPIVVTFSTDYRTTAPFMVALRVNGGPCVLYGPAYIPAFSPDDWTYASTTMQWIIMPGDYKLAPGPNKIAICGGGTNSADDTITLGFHTLTAQLAK